MLIYKNITINFVSSHSLSLPYLSFVLLIIISYFIWYYRQRCHHDGHFSTAVVTITEATIAAFIIRERIVVLSLSSWFMTSTLILFHNLIEKYALLERSTLIHQRQLMAQCQSPATGPHNKTEMREILAHCFE